MGVKKIFRIGNGWFDKISVVPKPSSRKTLDQQLARFLRQQRGELSFEKFSRKTGLTPSTLFRLENGQQTITLRRLGQMMERLKISWTDIFDGRDR